MTDVQPLQTTLAAEHAAVYLYGVLGGRTSQSAQPALYAAVVAAYDAHRARRDRLSAQLSDAGATPVAAEAAYDVPGGDPVGPARVAEVALTTERSCATTYSWLVASSTGATRRWAIQALNEAAVRELAFRGTPEMLPGAGEYADR